MSLAAPRNELTCDICIDIITDIDEWLTSDKTEQEIVDFVSEVKSIKRDRAQISDPYIFAT